MKINLLPVIALYIVVNVTACTQGPAGADAAAGTGMLTGRAVLARLAKDLSAEEDNSGITVSVEGTALATQSDKNGAWTLNNVPAGRRTVVFRKAGYGTMRVPNVPVVAEKHGFVYDMPGAQYDAVWLGKLISLDITAIRMTVDDNVKNINVPKFTADITAYPPDSIPMTFSLLFKKSAPPTPESYDWVKYNYRYSSIVPPEELWQAGINPGDTFYVSAVGHLSGEKFLYQHPATGRVVISTAEGQKGATASFVLPPYRK
jgi:hypothetical protein